MFDRNTYYEFMIIIIHIIIISHWKTQISHQVFCIVSVLFTVYFLCSYDLAVKNKGNTTSPNFKVNLNQSTGIQHVDVINSSSLSH